MKINKVIVASDHAGFTTKSQVINYLKEQSIKVIDAGTNSEERVDYPDIADQAIKRFFNEKADCIILICGTGIGMSIAANKHKGIRCALVHNDYTARMAREHNHANCLALSSRVENSQPVETILASFISSEEQSGRHLERINKIMELENEK